MLAILVVVTIVVVVVAVVGSVDDDGEKVGRGRVLSKRLSSRTAFFGRLAAVLLVDQLPVLRVSLSTGSS